jgi:uncharacterized phage-associated protein
VAKSMLRFRMNWDKAVEAVHYLTDLHPNITRIYIAKVLFFADKEHLLDWGRPICGDSYVAMVHGPVPSNVYNLVRGHSKVPPSARARFDHLIGSGSNEVAYRALRPFKQHYLSKSDLDALKQAHTKYGRLGWEALIAAGHKEVAWREAWSHHGLLQSIPMNPERLISDDVPDRDALIEEICEKAQSAAA